MASGKWAQAWPIYDRELAEAHLALKGYVPVRLKEKGEQPRVGIRCYDTTMQCLCQDRGESSALMWYASVTSAWQECEWATIPHAVLHNIWRKWQARYERRDGRNDEP